MTRPTIVLLALVGLIAGACGGGTSSEERFRAQMLDAGFMTDSQVDCFLVELDKAGLSVDDISDDALANTDDLPAGATDALFTCLLGDAPSPDAGGDSLDGPGTPGAGSGNDGPLTSGTANDYGDDPALDRLWDACEAGDGQACDDLFFQSPFDSRYEEFGNTCGGRFDIPPVSCADEMS